MLIKIIANRGTDCFTPYPRLCLSTKAGSRFSSARSCLLNVFDGSAGRSLDGLSVVSLLFWEGKSWPVLLGWLKLRGLGCCRRSGPSSCSYPACSSKEGSSFTDDTCSLWLFSSAWPSGRRATRWPSSSAASIDSTDPAQRLSSCTSWSSRDCCWLWSSPWWLRSLPSLTTSAHACFHQLLPSFRYTLRLPARAGSSVFPSEDGVKFVCFGAWPD